MWSFGNSFAINIVIFPVENSSSSLSDKHTNNFSNLGEGDTPKRKFSIDFSKANTKFRFKLLFKGDNNYFFLLMRKKSLNLNLIKMLTS